MQRAPWTKISSSQPTFARIGDYDPVRPELAKGKKIGIQSGKITIMGQDIDGHIDLNLPGMGIGNRLLHLIEIKIAGLGA